MSSTTIDSDALQGLIGYQVPAVDGTVVQNISIMANNRTDGLNFYMTEERL